MQLSGVRPSVRLSVCLSRSSTVAAIALCRQCHDDSQRTQVNTDLFKLNPLMINIPTVCQSANLQSQSPPAHCDSSYNCALYKHSYLLINLLAP